MPTRSIRSVRTSIIEDAQVTGWIAIGCVERYIRHMGYTASNSSISTSVLRVHTVLKGWKWESTNLCRKSVLLCIPSIILSMFLALFQNSEHFLLYTPGKYPSHWRSFESSCGHPSSSHPGRNPSQCKSNATSTRWLPWGLGQYSEVKDQVRVQNLWWADN